MGERGRLTNSELLEVIWLIWTRPNFLFASLWIWRPGQEDKANETGWEQEGPLLWCWPHGDVLSGRCLHLKAWWTPYTGHFGSLQGKNVTVQGPGFLPPRPVPWGYRSCKQDKARLESYSPPAEVPHGKFPSKECMHPLENVIIPEGQRGTSTPHDPPPRELCLLPGNTGVEASFQE